MRTSIALLPALVVGIVIAAGPALAQSAWSGSTPAFDSDARRVAEQAEAERAARRATQSPVAYPKHMDGGERPDIKPAEPPIVYFDQNEDAGSIIIDTQGRKLYYVLPGKKAYQYPISVGRDGFTWSGTERISRIAAWPAWTPPPEMHKRQPGLPITVSGGLKNPQGARAIYLGNTIYRIHGTNNDRTVGRANSSGCFRLTNEHVVHLASIAKVGRQGAGAAGLRGRRQRERAAVLPVQLLASRAGEAGGSPQGSEAGGEEGNPSSREDRAAAGTAVTATDGGQGRTVGRCQQGCGVASRSCRSSRHDWRAISGPPVRSRKPSDRSHRPATRKPHFGQCPGKVKPRSWRKRRKGTRDERDDVERRDSAGVVIWHGAVAHRRGRARACRPARRNFRVCRALRPPRRPGHPPHQGPPPRHARARAPPPSCRAARAIRPSSTAGRSTAPSAARKPSTPPWRR